MGVFDANTVNDNISFVKNTPVCSWLHRAGKNSLLPACEQEVFQEQDGSSNDEIHPRKFKKYPKFQNSTTRLS